MKGASGGIVSVGPPVQREYDIEWVRGLEDLCESAGMNCEQLPLEVREALHRVPELDKQHVCALSRG